MNNLTGILVISAFLLAIILLFWLNRQCVAANKKDWGNVWLNRLDGLLRLFCIKYHRLSPHFLDLPETGGAIVISNHVSGLDPLLIVAAAKRPVHFIIAREEYERFGLQWLFRAVGCIPIDRQGRSELALREAIRLLNEGGVIAMFPYGGIHTKKELLPRFKRGVVLLAHSTNTPVFPLSISGIAGEGHTVMAVPIRSHAQIKQHQPVNCDAMEQKKCIELLDAIFRNNE